MIQRILDRILEALERIENPKLVPQDRIPRFVASHSNRSFGTNGLGFTIMNDSSLVIDMNIVIEQTFQPFVSSMISLAGCNIHSFADGLLLTIPAGIRIPMEPHSILDQSEVELPVLLIAQTDPNWKAAIDPEDVVAMVSSQEETLFSGALYNNFLRTTQAEPIILLRQLRYLRVPNEAGAIKIALISVQQVQIIYTSVVGSASRVGPVKTNLNLDPWGVPHPKRLPFIPAFTWNPTREHNEHPLGVGYAGPNGMHFYHRENDTEHMRDFIRWVSQINIRPDRPGWFANAEDEVRALGWLSGIGR